MTRCDADFRINLRFIGIRQTVVEQHGTTVLRYHARSVGSGTTCTVRAKTTQDGTIPAWMAVMEMCLIGTRGCLSTCRVRFRDTQRALLSQTIPQPTRCIPHVPQVTTLSDTRRNLSGTTLPCN